MQSLFFNSLTAIFDPHSQYFPPRDKEEFDIEMSGALEGIGALLGEDDGFIKVFEVIAGSPAWIQGILKAEDVILKVGQGDEEPVDIVGMSVSDAARLVRGKKGSPVRLTVRKPDGRIMQVALVRNVVELQETYARSAFLSSDPLKQTFGYLYLPKFYHDFNRAGGRNAADDVDKEIRKLAARGVAGMILDLRGNGGGALDDAVKLTRAVPGEGPGGPGEGPPFGAPGLRGPRRRHQLRRAAGHPGQFVQRLGVGDRRRRPPGLSPRRGGRRPDLRQGDRAGHARPGPLPRARHEQLAAAGGPDPDRAEILPHHRRLHPVPGGRSRHRPARHLRLPRGGRKEPEKFPALGHRPLPLVLDLGRRAARPGRDPEKEASSAWPPTPASAWWRRTSPA